MKSTILLPFFINGPLSERVCIVKPTEEMAKSNSLRASLKEQSQDFLSKFLVQQTKKKKFSKIYGSTALAVPILAKGTLV